MTFQTNSKIQTLHRNLRLMQQTTFKMNRKFNRSIMSNKYLMGVAAAALALSSCTQDEMVSMQQDAISYSVFAKNQTRAADSYCAINLPEGFNVYAKTSGENNLYINGDYIKKEGSSWVDQSGTRYWPETGNLDFVAHVNDEGKFNFNLTGQSTFDGYVINNDVTMQKDLMYAVNSGVAKSSTPVSLNFRHALSQVCFKAQNQTSNLRITIKSVTVGHLNGEGTYTLPELNTDVNILDNNHNNGITAEPSGVNRGSWKFSDDQNLKSYTATVNGGSVQMDPKSAEADNLTTNTQGHNVQSGWANVMMLMPQEQKAWDSTKKDLDGAYFKLNIMMEQSVVDDNGIVTYNPVFGSDGNGYVYIPVTINWNEGVRYIYTFNFKDDGNGGWVIPEDPDDPNGPTPALTAVDYAVEIDDFISDNNSNDMEAYNYKATVKLYNNYYSDKTSYNSVTVKTNTNPFDFDLSSYALKDKSSDYFAGWSTTSDGNAIEGIYQITFDKDEYSLYAVWEPFLTVRYTDGVEGIVVFQDQSNEGLKPGDATPKFMVNGVETDPVRENYKFKGWANAINPIVSADDVNDDENTITYTAQWSGTFISISSDRENYNKGDDVKFTILIRNSTNETPFESVKYVMPEGLEFDRLSEGDVSLYNGKYDASSRIVTWSNVNVPIQGSKQLLVWAKVSSDTNPGSVSNKAELINNGKTIDDDIVTITIQ